MAVLNGNNITFVVNPTEGDTKLAFAHSTECSLSFTNELVEVTTEDTNGWIEYISARKSVSISFSGLSDYGTITERYNVVDVADYLRNGTLLHFDFGDVGDLKGVFGMGYINELTLEGSTDGVATYSGSFVITEDLSKKLTIMTVPLLDSDGNNLTDSDGNNLLARIAS